jgi:uncharacterized protein YndB with AHSA1/START domain
MTPDKDAVTLNEPLVVERVFNAPIERVWKAITNADQMRHWYFELEEFRAEKGFEFEFTVEHNGHTYHHLCQITDVAPPKKLVHTWRYAGEVGISVVSWELFPEGDRTRLKLTHEGLDSFPQLPSFARENFQQGWTAIIGSSLEEYLENHA